VTQSVEEKTISIRQLTWIGSEVKRQKADADEVVGMARAVLYMQDIPWKNEPFAQQFDMNDLFRVNCLVRGMLEFRINRMEPSYRSTPVVFQSGGPSCHPQSVPYAMAQLLDNIPDLFIEDSRDRGTDIDIWIKQFLWIHPFKDGNGRTASILANWMFAPDGLDHPFRLPDYKF